MTIAQTIRAIDPILILVGLSNPEMGRAADDTGLPFANEVFGDRRHTDSGCLVSRSEPGAVIDSEFCSFEQVEQMILRKQVIRENGKAVAVDPQTVCVHGDTSKGKLFIKNIFKLRISQSVR